jgi:hypothetical protein
LIQVNDRLGFPGQSITMSGTDRHNRGYVSASEQRRVGAILQFGSRCWRPLFMAMTFLLVASLVHASSGARIDPPGKVSMAVAAAPSDDPCGSSHGAFHDHALCCSPASCSAFVTTDAAFAIALDGRASAIAGSDSNFRSQAPPALFHPPKLLIVA